MPNLQERIRQAASDATVTGGDTTLRDEFEAFKTATTEALQNIVDNVQRIREDIQAKLGNG